MRIEAIIQEATITLTWTINSCAQQYEVTHYVNGEVNLNLLIAHPLNFLPLERHDCSHNRVTISLIPVPGAGDFTEASYEFIVGFPGKMYQQVHNYTYIHNFSKTTYNHG